MVHNDPKVSQPVPSPQLQAEPYGTDSQINFSQSPIQRSTAPPGPLALAHDPASWLPLYRISSGSASDSPRAYKVRSTMKSTMSETDFGFR